MNQSKIDVLLRDGWLIKETDEGCIYCHNLTISTWRGCCGENHYEPIYYSPLLCETISQSELENFKGDEGVFSLPVGSQNEPREGACLTNLALVTPERGLR